MGAHENFGRKISRTGAATQRAFIDSTQVVPRHFARLLFARKLEDAGVTPTDDLVHRLADHLFDSPQAPFPTLPTDPDIALTLTSADLEEIRAESTAFIFEKTPVVLERVVTKLARSAVTDLKRTWRGASEERALDDMQFYGAIDALWQEPLELFEITLASACDLNNTFLKRSHRAKLRSRTGKNVVRNMVLGRLHGRACQVSTEIITLLRAGLADGAYARWRTLHEVCVVALLIKEHGDTLAIRYLDHEAIEHMAALETFDATRGAYGARPVPKREHKAIHAAYDEALRVYGRDFRSEYGWASGIVAKGQPNFKTLEAAAGRSATRLHYKMASYGVHAGQRGIRFSLGMPDISGLHLTGASVLGLEDPGLQATASLIVLTSLLVPDRPTTTQMIMMKILLTLRDQTSRAFIRAAKTLNENSQFLERLSKSE